ncbi:helix-turn-helix domain-containing protein [Natroniella acetigena]|uniref:helix-turn-helix domain-containing protein n=1 Tax=Natroniella acetigena TaxID=52004 RepID=UPI00200B6C5B|nr:helix-turn-helix transcriptional regulator [Natroniella acetigena]MCK8826333.1 helix-turn-helix domain-containing protein [Natroniella acetigena]
MPKPPPPQELPEDTVGQRIKKARLIKELNKKQLAKKAGMCDNTIIDYEKERYTPSVKNYVKLAEALDVKIDWLSDYDTLPKKTLGQKVKKCRLLKGWTQSELAQRAALDPTTISRIEQDKVTNPDSKTMKKLKHTLGKLM